MDPLTITCSAVTLIQATNSIASSLYAAVQLLRTADERIASLCDELQSLSGLLGAVDKTLGGCRPADVALVEDDLWRQSELVLMDCQITLREMEVLVGRVREAARDDQPQLLARGWALRWRARAAVGLSIHGPAIAAFRDRIQKSSWALQTILQTITVSMSIRNSASQDAVLLALNKLNSTINDAIYASVRRPADVSMQQNQPGDQSDARMAQNLRRLAEAARHFHSTASSTASTVRSSSVCIDSWDVHSDTAAISLVGGLSPFQRQRIEGFIDGQMEHRYQSSSHDTFSTLIPVSSDGNSRNRFARRKRSECEKEDEDEDAIIELDWILLDGLEELAQCHIRDGRFAKAIPLLQKALEQNVSSLVGTRLRRLRVLSALCYIMQGDWRLAEPLVLQLAETAERHRLEDRPVRCDLEVVGNLLHAVALGHLCAFSLDGALKRCRQAWQIRNRLMRQHARDSDGNIDQDSDAWNGRECLDTLGLLATIYETRGDYIRAEMLWQQQPEFAYIHPANEIHFLQRHGILLHIAELFPPKRNGQASSARLSGARMQELDGEGTHPPSAEAAISVGLSSPYNIASAEAVVERPEVQESRLRVRQDQWERQEIDTGKEVYFGSPPDSAICLQDDAVEDASSDSPSSRMSSLQRKLTRLLRSRKEVDISVEKSLAVEDLERHEHRDSSKAGTRWLSRGGSLFRKSKTLLRKRSVRGTSTGGADTEQDTESTEDTMSYCEGEDHDEDDICSCASTPTLDSTGHWVQQQQQQKQQQQQQQQQQTCDRTADFFYPLPDLWSVSEHEHLFWEPPLPTMPELMGAPMFEMLADIAMPVLEMSADAVATGSSSRPTVAWVTADTILGTDTAKRRGVRKRPTDMGPLTALVLRQLDMLYILNTAQPAWLNDLEIWFDDWPEKLLTRYPTWAQEDGARCLRYVGHLEDTEDREEKQNVAQHPISTVMEQRNLRRALSWSSGSKAGLFCQPRWSEAPTGLSRKCTV